MTAEPTPLSVVPEAAPAIEATPEQYLVSALLDSGSYDPRSYGVPDYAIRGHADLHAFCVNYQADAGQAPPLHLVLARYPSFVYVPGVSPVWAAAEVTKAETNRRLRKAITKAAQAVKDESHAEAVAVLREAIAEIHTGGAPGTSISDLSLLRASAAEACCPIPPGRLADLTGGHSAGQLWYVCAPPGYGKSWRLVEHSIAAAEAGWDVAFFSMEMRTTSVLERLHRVALRDWARPVPLMGLDERQAAINEWEADCGRITVYGPERGRVDASTISSMITHRRTLIVVDYIGRMYTTAGVPAKKDYQSVSMVSQELGELAGYRDVPVLAAAQLNRMGDIAGSMDLERDADVIIEVATLSAACVSVRKNILRKIRDGQQTPPWYTRFDPTTGHFGDIDNETAYTMRMADETISI